MPRIVRGGLIQAKNVLGPEAGLPEIKKAMVDKHVKLIAEAARKKVQLLCLQEIFYGPYFCAEQETRWYHLTERVPDGPTVTLMRKLAKKHKMVIVVPIYEEEQPGRLLQHRGRDRRRRDATSASTARPTSRTASRASGRSSTSVPATSATRCSRPPSPRSASTSATTATSPRAPARSASPAPRSCSTPRRRSRACRSTCGSSSSRRTRSPTATSWARSTASGIEPPWKMGEFYGKSYFCDPRGKIVAQAPRDKDAVVVADLNLDMIEEVRVRLAVLPRPPSRRLRPAGRALTPGSLSSRLTRRHAHARRSHGRRPVGHLHRDPLREPVPAVLGAAHRVGEQHPARLRGGLGRSRHQDDRHAPGRQREGAEDQVHAHAARDRASCR